MCKLKSAVFLAIIFLAFSTAAVVSSSEFDKNKIVTDELINRICDYICETYCGLQSQDSIPCANTERTCKCQDKGELNYTCGVDYFFESQCTMYIYYIDNESTGGVVSSGEEASSYGIKTTTTPQPPKSSTCLDTFCTAICKVQELSGGTCIENRCICNKQI